MSKKPDISKIEAMQILHIWAVFQGGQMLTPENVVRLLKPFLDEAKEKRERKKP